MNNASKTLTAKNGQLLKESEVLKEERAYASKENEEEVGSAKLEPEDDVSNFDSHTRENGVPYTSRSESIL